MIVGGTPQQKKSNLFSPWRSSPALASPAKPATTTPSGGCCRSFSDCRTMKSPHQPPNKFELQVAELEKEVGRQKEERDMYKMKMERAQDYLRYCLQVAQENGFLDTIIKCSKDNQQQDPTTKDIQQDHLHSSHHVIHATSVSPRTPPPVPQHPDFATLVDQAKISGWYIEPHEIELHQKVAQGTTADIYKGTWRGLDVAVKCLFPDFFHSNDTGIGFFAQEIETLSRQRHKFVLQLMGACLDPPDYGWVVTEFFDMTLREWLHGPGSRRRQRIVPLPPFQERLSRALEIAQAIQYLHEHKPIKVIHRDLKPSNIFLDDAMHVRVADFGHARFLCDGEMALTGETGKDRTYVYMAPEVMRCEPYSEKCDVYSFGIILNELITGEYPYIETDFGPAKIAMEVVEGRLRPRLPEDENHLLEDLIDLIKHSWDEDADMRPSFEMITLKLRNIQQGFTNTIYDSDYII
ncbi:serine/threonine-protein kinase STY8-like [Cornus florida]|uniref:serine/threonine-protein kinase STY8-like n=1 Tax=Cornus florida TaxID=4283 RepID=UPI00289E9C52|nr:serine/threonine-protein kinase STY8-like [Cornus florida]